MTENNIQIDTEENKTEPRKASAIERFAAWLAVSRKRKVLLICILVLIALLLTAAAGVVTYLHFSRFTVTYVTAEGSVTKTVSSMELVPFPDVTAPEKLNFVGWKDSQGNIEKKSAVCITENTVYTAQYITALNTTDHIPYLFADDDGLYRPNELFTRGEAAIAIKALLCGVVQADKNYADITDDMDCATATAQLKALGIVGKSRFYPDDAITWIDLIHILSAFYQQTDEQYEFSFISAGDNGYEDCCTAASLGWIDETTDLDPDGTMTRLEAAVFINHVLGRTGDPDLTLSDTGILPDCSPFNSDYLQFAEAAVEHSYERSETGTEHWTASSAPQKQYSGYVTVAGKLRFADEDGLFVTGTNDDGLTFQADGSYTSGSEELDEVVWTILARITDESMTQEEKLHAAYNYLVENYLFKANNTYDQGATDWVIEEALSLFTDGAGSSYSFAGAFWALARGLGYPAIAESGLELGNAHGWVTIKEDDTWYIYDPAMEIDSKMDGWKMDRIAYYPWGYNPDPQITYGPAPESTEESY